MSKSPQFARLARAGRIAAFADRFNLSSAEAVARADAGPSGLTDLRPEGWSRRQVLRGSAAAVAAAGLGGRAWAAPTRRSDIEVAIIGAGMAGVACAYELQRFGIQPAVYDAGTRVGGRIFSHAPAGFGGTVVELGGELIDTGHTTMRAYARDLGLTLEDYNKQPGEGRWYCDGRLVEEHEVVDEYRVLVDAMRDDLRRIGAPTAFSFSPDDEAFDHLDLATWLDARPAGRIIRDAIDAAYTGEYGRGLDEQSCLNFLLFIHADRRSQFAEFGQFSDERFHVVGGNQQIPAGLAAQLVRPISFGHELIALARTPGGAYRLTFLTAGGVVEQTADAVVLAVPFSILRDVHLDDSLALPPEKHDAIQRFTYGHNAKTMVAFEGRPWQDLHSNGGVYAVLDEVQNVWETSPTQGAQGTGVLTDFSSARRGLELGDRPVAGSVEAWLAELERVLPGVPARARRSGGDPTAVRMHWPSAPQARGSYTCNAPGYFTTIAGWESVPVDNLFFAGEHADSFYEWQGFMEGAANSGIAASLAIRALARVP